MQPDGFPGDWQIGYASGLNVLNRSECQRGAGTGSYQGKNRVRIRSFLDDSWSDPYLGAGIDEGRAKGRAAFGGKTDEWVVGELLQGNFSLPRRAGVRRAARR
jgi:hypothetical protein